MVAKKPKVQAAPVNPEVDPEAQASADEAARKARERQQKGVSASKTILTNGLEDEFNTRKVNLGA